MKFGRIFRRKGLITLRSPYQKETSLLATADASQSWAIKKTILQLKSSTISIHGSHEQRDRHLVNSAQIHTHARADIDRTTERHGRYHSCATGGDCPPQYLPRCHDRMAD